MLFADDVVLCGESQEKLEARLETWRRAMEDRGMRVLRQKTEYLCIGEGEADEKVRREAEGGRGVQVLGFNCTDGWGNWERGAEEDSGRVGYMEEDNEIFVRRKSATKAKRQAVQDDDETSDAVRG